MSSVDALTLDSLPSDVSRRIIRLEQESIPSMKLISPRWNALAVEYLNDRKNIHRFPKIDHFIWRISDSSTFLSFRTSSRYLEYFGLQKWSSNESSLTTSDDEVCRNFSTTDVRKILPYLIVILKKCSRICTLELHLNIEDNKNEIKLIRTALRQFIINDLLFSGIECLSEFENYRQGVVVAILKTARAFRHIQRLLILSENYESCNLGHFLIEAVRVAKSVVIETVITKRRNSTPIGREWKLAVVFLQRTMHIKFEQEDVNRKMMRLRIVAAAKWD